jgi:amidophosphoribosyltransferase
MAVSQGSRIIVIKDMGLVTDVLSRQKVGFLEGHVGIGHTRYSTTGSSTWENAQPSFRSIRCGEFALAHNGNLTNTLELSEDVGDSSNGASSDSDIIAELLIRELGSSKPEAQHLEAALKRVLPRLEGAFSLVLMDATCIVGVRDPNGFRPLCLGQLDAGWALASETAALDALGARFAREILPGEMVIIDSPGEPRSVHPFPVERIDPRLCVFEFVYLARPDSQLYGREVNGARIRMGAMLAKKAPVEADMVMGVPDSGIPAAEGYADASGIRYGSGLVKNRYIGRTFINPTQDDRERNARRKLNVLRERVNGKRLIVVEDSLVRGSTTRFLARMLREAGATEVHLRVALPPVKWPCYYGIDIGTRAELLAANLTLEEIRDLLEVDTLAYLTIAELKAAIGLPGAGFCDACMTSDYPIQLRSRQGKHLLERTKLRPVEPAANNV